MKIPRFAGDFFSPLLAGLTEKHAAPAIFGDFKKSFRISPRKRLF
jgi:hypothetical protein